MVWHSTPHPAPESLPALHLEPVPDGSRLDLAEPLYLTIDPATGQVWPDGPRGDRGKAEWDEVRSAVRYWLDNPGAHRAAFSSWGVVYVTAFGAGPVPRGYYP